MFDVYVVHVQYFHRFVRFTNKESAICAVCELNHWVLNGNNIIVALEKSTVLKIEQGIVVIM